MLTSMRKGASGWIAKILFALLILSFGAWGITDYLTPDPDPVIATVGDSEVRQSAYRNQFSRSLDALRNQIGSNVTQELAVQMGLDDDVLDAIITQQVLTREGARMGLAVSDSMLRSAIASNPAFQGPTGQFDQLRFEQVLFQNGMSESQFLADLQGRLLRDPLIGAATAAPPAPALMAQSQYGFDGEKRRVTVVFRNHNTVEAPEDPGDTTLRAFYDKEESFYQQAELRDLSAIVLRPEEVAKTFDIADDLIAEEYENRLNLYRTPERRRVSQLLFDNAADAAKAVARLNGGENWVSVAGDSGGRATDLGDVGKNDLLTPELGEAAYAIAEPGAAGPVETAFGHHVLLVSAISPAGTRPLEDVRDEIKQALALDLAVDELVERANAVEDSIAAGDSLEQAADAAGVSIQSFQGVARNGFDAAGNRIETLPRGGQFLAVAYQTEDGQNSILTDSPDGGYFLLRVDRITPETKKPFDSVRETVLKDWQDSQRSEQAGKQADALAEKLRGGADPAEAATGASFEVAEPPAFRRTAAPVPLTPDFVEKAFATPTGEYFTFNDLQRAYIGRVDEVISADASDAEALEAIRQRQDRDRRLEVGLAFQQAVRSAYDVTVDHDAIAYVLGERRGQ